MSELQTQRFLIVVATDGDVAEGEVGGVFDAVGYHGLLVLDLSKTEHEHPCPSRHCIDQLRSEGHGIPEGADCCICWAMEKH